MGVYANGNGLYKKLESPLPLNILNVQLHIRISNSKSIKLMKTRFIILLVIFSSSVFSQSNYELGLKKYNEEANEQAIEFFNKSIVTEENLTETYMMRGAAFIQLGLYDKAIADLEKSITLGSTNHMTFTYMGRAYASKEVHW